MPIRINYELDPVFESMGLLFLRSRVDETKKQTIAALSDFGFDGEQFYEQYLKIYDKYVQAFLKNGTLTTEDELFFGEKDLKYFLVLFSFITNNRSWLVSAEEATDETVREQLIRSCKTGLELDFWPGTVETLQDMISFLDQSGLEASAKWKLFHLLQQPKKHMLQLVHIVNANKEAYYKAVSEIAKPLAKLLDRFTVSANDLNSKSLHETLDKLLQASNVFPSLVFPLLQLFHDDICYYGLLSELVIQYGKDRQQSKEALLQKLKALSDSSKLEILISLKISPKYNLEIAQQLGLTPATMSHHMSVLLNCGLVGVEKKDGKVYYHLQKENIGNLIQELAQTIQ